MKDVLSSTESSSDRETLVGSFARTPLILSAVASNAGNNVELADGDEVTIVFDEHEPSWRSWCAGEQGVH